MKIILHVKLAQVAEGKMAREGLKNIIIITIPGRFNPHVSEEN